MTAPLVMAGTDRASGRASRPGAGKARPSAAAADPASMDSPGLLRPPPRELWGETVKRGCSIFDSQLLVAVGQLTCTRPGDRHAGGGPFSPTTVPCSGACSA